MKKFILITTLIVSIISCKDKTKSDSNVETINIENLTPGPIIHESLNENQLEKIKFIQETLNDVLLVSLEKTIANFKRDQNPDNEINIWLNMAKAYEAFSLKNPEDEKINLRKEAFKLIFMRSMMSEEEIMKNEIDGFKLLKRNDVKEIFENYTLEPKPITINK